MPAFKRLNPEDQLDNVLILHPSYDLVSGSQGWRGSPEGSASLSLYGGARRRPGGVFSKIEYQSFAPNVSQTGNPQRGLPMTASIQFAYMTEDPRPSLNSLTPVRWWEEHWGAVNRLYDDYSSINSEYITSSYDYYCVYLNRDSRNILVNESVNNGVQTLLPTGSFCYESWVKPFQTQSLTNDFTVASINRMLWFGITGSTGRLVFSSSVGAFTGSTGPRVNRWSHVAITYDESSLTGTLLINGSPVGFFGHAPLVGSPSYTGSLTFGNRSSGALSSTESPNQEGELRSSFHGLMGETRAWHQARSPNQIIAAMTASLIGNEVTSSFVTLRLNEGPLAYFGDAGGDFISPPQGSGSYNVSLLFSYSEMITSIVTRKQPICRLNSFNDRVGPVWHPNDNPSFVVPKKNSGDLSDPARLLGEYFVLNGFFDSITGGPAIPPSVLPVRSMLVAHVPSAFYGRQVVPNSVRMTCRAFESFGFVRTLIDDGRGGLYLSGSVCSSSLEDREDYGGVQWNKVGNVFYGEGLVVIKDPSILDFGRTDGAALVPTDTLSLSFKGDSRIPVKTLMCRIDHGEFNCTTNPTFSVTGSAGELLRRHSSGSIRVSTVGIYNSNRDLVAIARMADPVRIRARDRINIRLRLDF